MVVCQLQDRKKFEVLKVFGFSENSASFLYEFTHIVKKIFWELNFCREKKGGSVLRQNIMDTIGPGYWTLIPRWFPPFFRRYIFICKLYQAIADQCTFCKQCCGSGSQRIWPFVQDPDPNDWFGSGSVAERIRIKIVWNKTWFLRLQTNVLALNTYW